MPLEFKPHFALERTRVSTREDARTRGQLGSRDGTNGKQHRENFWASFLGGLRVKPATTVQAVISPVLVK